MFKPDENLGNGPTCVSEAAVGDPLIGSVFDDRFEIIEFVGAGGWGNVYKARHLTLGINVAIKIIHKHLRSDNSSLQRLQREALLLSRLDSPNIIKFMDYGLTPAPFIVMEFFDGVALDKWLQSSCFSNSALMLELFMQICQGLSSAHAQGLVHRDLKPANVMLRFESGKLRAKILDFGIAKPADDETRLTCTGELVGSPAYMPPEQWKGQSDCRSDIYSFGCIMYEVLSHRAPFEAKNGLEYMDKHLFETPAKLQEQARKTGCPEALGDLIGTCLEKVPEKRYQSADCVYAELERVKNGRKLLIHLNKERRVQRKRLAALSVASLAGAFALFWLFKDFLLCPWMLYFNTIADIEISQAKYSMASGNYRLSLLPSKILSAQNRQVLHAMRMLSSSLVHEKHITEAVSLQRQVAKAIGTPCSLEFANELRTLSYRQYVGASPKETQYLAQKADEDARSLAGKRSLAYSQALETDANVLSSMGSLKEALQAEDQSLEIANDLLEPNDILIAEKLNSKADILNASGSLNEAEQNYQQALNLSVQCTKNPSELDYATVSLPAKPSPLVLADFNNGAKINNLEADMGTWEKDISDKTQGTKISFAADDESQPGHGGKSLVLDYDVDSPNQASNGFWMKLGSSDFSAYDTLNFYIKGDESRGYTRRLKIELKDFTNKPAPVYIDHVSNKWQKISIPFSKFKMISDWSRMNEFTVCFEDVASLPKTGRIYFDQVYVSSENQESKNIAPTQIVRAYNGCASICAQRKDMAGALEYLQKAEQLCLKHEELDSLPTYISLAKYYEQAGNNLNASNYWMLALKTHVEDGSSQCPDTGRVLDALAAICFRTGDYKQGKIYSENSLKVKTQSSNLEDSLKFVLGKNTLPIRRINTGHRSAIAALHAYGTVVQAPLFKRQENSALRTREHAPRATHCSLRSVMGPWRAHWRLAGFEKLRASALSKYQTTKV